MSHKELSEGSPLREAHLRDYWKIIWQGRWTALAVFLLVVTLTALWTFLQTPIYRATATVEVRPRALRVLGNKQDVSGLGAGSFGWFGEEKYHNTQVEIIKSRDVSTRVVNLLDLRSHPMFSASSAPIESFRSMIRVDPRRETGLIEISIEGAEPAEITQWVNAVAKAYVDRNREGAEKNLKRALEAIDVQIESMRGDLTDSEKERLETLRKSNIFDTENQEAIVRQRLEKYHSDLNDVELELARLEDVLTQVRGMDLRGPDWMSVPELAEDEVLRELFASKIEIESELEVAKVSVLPSHPEYEKRVGQSQKLQSRIEQRVALVLSRAANSHKLAEEQRRFLERQIEDTQMISFEVARAKSEYEIIKSNADTQKNIFDLINQRMIEVQLELELMNSNIELLDEALPPRFPVRPRNRANLMIGGMLGLVLGLGAVFFLDYLDNTIRTPEDVEKFLGLSVLGVIPKAAQASLNQRAGREAYQSLRTSVIFSSKNRERKVVLVTSSAPQEGKSSTVANLGRTLASSGDRVVLLDCDLRRPRQHEIHGVDREPGITNYLAGAHDDTDWRGRLQNREPNLYLLTCGPIPPSPPDLLDSERMRDLLAQLRENFDWVLIDSPPAASLADASILATMAEMVVGVVRHNHTDRDLVVKTMTQLRGVNPSMAGIVLNNVDIERSFHKDYYYAGYYYYDEDEKAGGRGVKRKAG